MLSWPRDLKIFATLLAIVPPIGSIPVFIGLTNNQEKAGRYRTAFLGDSLLRLFGAGIASLLIRIPDQVLTASHIVSQ